MGTDNQPNHIDNGLYISSNTFITGTGMTLGDKAFAISRLAYIMPVQRLTRCLVRLVQETE